MLIKTGTTNSTSPRWNRLGCDCFSRNMKNNLIKSYLLIFLTLSSFSIYSEKTSTDILGDEIKNLVSVEGAVMIPGRYELNKNLSVRSLIKSAGGFKDNALKEIALKAIRKKTGARGLRSILENILLKTMFELPDMENVVKVTVDATTVKGASEPIITYGKKSSTSVA